MKKEYLSQKIREIKNKMRCEDYFAQAIYEKKMCGYILL